MKAIKRRDSVDEFKNPTSSDLVSNTEQILQGTPFKVAKFKRNKDRGIEFEKSNIDQVQSLSIQKLKKLSAQTN